MTSRSSRAGVAAGAAFGALTEARCAHAQSVNESARAAMVRAIFIAIFLSDIFLSYIFLSDLLPTGKCQTGKWLPVIIEQEDYFQDYSPVWRLHLSAMRRRAPRSADGDLRSMGFRTIR